MRYIVETKSRGFDVVDTTATPRADGFWCYCVDRERAQVIADKLNEAEFAHVELPGYKKS